MSAPFPRSLSDFGGGIVDPGLSTRYIFRALEEGIGEGGIAAVNTSDSQGVLFLRKFIYALLALMGDVAMGELVAVKGWMSATARAIKKARER